MNSFQIRDAFFNFFKKNNHTQVPSSSLIPAQDPTLLFANAGMNQFKDLFLGQEVRSYSRATSIQKCVRAGGKHNDLDQVGFTARHLTFFEMMGNFSFGDYFKKEAIAYAWDFCTKDMNLPQDKLHVTVFETDDEAFDIWNKEIGLSSSHITRLGAKDNFWQMGDVGPCGPCSEIYMDMGKDIGCKSVTCKPGCDCPRFVEFWNLVFMQFDRLQDGSLEPLKKTGVDTGMGLDRLCMIVQNKKTVFETDLFAPIHKKIEELSGKSYETSSATIRAAFNVLADHIRSSCLIIADGGTPSNDGRGYVLRKIIRRAALFAQKISDDNSLFPSLGATFIDFFGELYPELKANKTLILTLLKSEIEKFAASLIQGKKIFQSYLDSNTDLGKTQLSGEQAFKLYDTYGFPLELTTILAGEHNCSVDIEGFQLEMQKQQEQSGKKTLAGQEWFDVPSSITTDFVGYETLESKSSISFVHFENNHGWIITEASPFYVESGGQVNDEGWISVADHSLPVIDLHKVVHSSESIAIAAKVDFSHVTLEVKKLFAVGAQAHCVVDSQKRTNTIRNHTATHMLQAALMQILGKGVKQAGSVVHDRYLRFDFTHHEAMTKDQITLVENLINQKIQEDIHTKVRHSTLAEAQELGIISFFGEKYNPENVRIVEVPGFSAELCGGTHATSTGILGAFKIISEVALSSGVRRIVAVTGPEALTLFQESFYVTSFLSQHFKVKAHQIIEAVEKQQALYLDSLKEIKNLKKKMLRLEIPQTLSHYERINHVPFLYKELADADNDEMKMFIKELEAQKPALFFLVSQQDQKIHFIAHLSAQFKGKINLRHLATHLKNAHGLRGGGSDVLIQGGGEAAENLHEEIRKWIEANSAH